MTAKNTSQAPSEEMVPIFVMGERFDVPASLTIQKAMEYAGYQLIRGCGCRGGVCGACGTVYRTPGSYRLEVGLACQTVVQPGMYLTLLPFFPGNRADYDITEMEGTGEEVAELYPEIFKCIGCNACTQSCPMDIDVMQYMARAIRGDVSGVAELSFDCIMCGLCASRCPAEEVQYNVAILCRRLHGRNLVPAARHLAAAVESIESGRFDDPLQELMDMEEKDLIKIYRDREAEPDNAEDDWVPEDRDYVVSRSERD